MIYTVTLNPSIDYVVHIDKLRDGLTNRTTSEEYYFGGKGINVSHVLAELDLPSTALGFVAGFTGEAIEKGTAGPMVRTDFIHLKEGVSRINVKIKSEHETEINGQGPHIDEEALQAFMEKTDSIRDSDTLILSGSIPKTMPDDTYERILERVKDRDVRIVVDATKQLLVNSLKYKPFLIKPNRQEISEIFNVEVKTITRWRFPSPAAAPRCSRSSPPPVSSQLMPTARPARWSPQRASGNISASLHRLQPDAYNEIEIAQRFQSSWEVSLCATTVLAVTAAGSSF